MKQAQNWLVVTVQALAYTGKYGDCGPFETLIMGTDGAILVRNYRNSSNSHPTMFRGKYSSRTFLNQSKA